MESIRFQRPLWAVYRFWTNADGHVDDSKDVESFWNQAQALDEAARLSAANADPDVFFEVLESVATGIYPADEAPPWEPDPDRLKRRGYEAHTPSD